MTKHRLANGWAECLSQTFTEKLEMSLIDQKDNTSLERGAANDIVRLRWRLKIRENIVARLVADNQRLRNGAATGCETVTLTEEERAAILAAADLVIGSRPAVILRNLLARLK